MKPNALVFDLDDTLIDTRERHYQLVLDFLKKQNIAVKFSFEEYLNIRLEKGFSNLEVLKHYHLNEGLENEFKTFWKEKIESNNYLALDKLIVDVKLLENASLTNDLYILSMRSNHKEALSQVGSFPFHSLIQNILFVNHLSNGNPKTADLMKLKKQYSEIKFIGDSGSDKEAANDASVNFVLVKTGIYKVNNEIAFTNVNTFLKQFQS